MTEDDAEAILMAVEVGLFHGRPSEVAHALLLVANREDETVVEMIAMPPVMKAWIAFRLSPIYENASRWAVHPEHVEGSLRAAFLQGWHSQEQEMSSPLSSSGEGTPLDDIEAHLVNAFNALHELVCERTRGRTESSRRQELNESIDAALHIVQAWKEEEQGEDGDHDAH